MEIIICIEVSVWWEDSKQIINKKKKSDDNKCFVENQNKVAVW